MSWSSRKKKEGIFCNVYFVRNKFFNSIGYTFRIYVLLHIKNHYFIPFCCLFLKSLKAFGVSFRTSYKELIWCINDPNAHIPTFCKCWSFMWRCFLPVCILNLEQFRSSVKAKQCDGIKFHTLCEVWKADKTSTICIMREIRKSLQEKLQVFGQLSCTPITKWQFETLALTWQA